jgi:hypothetical protein
VSGAANLKKSRREQILDEMEEIFMSATDKMETSEIKALNKKADKILSVAGRHSVHSAGSLAKSHETPERVLVLARAARM